MRDLFLELVRASGLSPVFAERSFERVLTKAGLTRDNLTKTHIRSLLPGIEKTLLLYLPPDEVSQRVVALRALAE
jgi:hypothetical protein